MAWPCYMVELHDYKFFLDGAEVPFNDLRPGAMWLDDGELCCKLPSGAEWLIDRGRLLNEQKPSRRLPQWTRTGEPPHVTATPSINHVGHYHGWLRDGVLTDDCEGRQFESEHVGGTP